MSRRSFDVFDTLLTRDVGKPCDLHLKTAQDLIEAGLMALPAEAFLSERVAAEAGARAEFPHGEPNLEKIYSELAGRLRWSEETMRRAMEAELRWEGRSIHGIPSMRPAVAQARREAGGVMFLSDMYLPADFLIELLRREGFYEDGDRLIVSNERGVSKASGAMFQSLIEEGVGTKDWKHTGDDLRADVQMPARFGIRAGHFVQAKLNRYEQTARGAGLAVPLWRSHLAGAMRLARLSKKTSDPHLDAVWDTACDVVGPLLFGFVNWCLEQAAARKCQRLYFVSRDGQIFFRIAEHLRQVWRYPVDCRYLYGSRRAWHPATIGNLGEADLDWLAPHNGQLTPRQVFARANLGPEAVAGILVQAGFRAEVWDRELSEEENQRMRSVLLDPRIKSLVADSARLAGSLAAEYLRQEGLMDEVPFGVVDIGWFGNMQRSLSRLISLTAGKADLRLAGFYLGLLPPARGQPNMWDYWSEPCGEGQPIERQATGMLEMFASADHPTVIGYGKTAQGVEPVFQKAGCDPLLKWGVKVLQDGALEFVRRFAPLCEKQNFAGRHFQTVAREIYERFYFHPTATEAKTWGCCLNLDSDIECAVSQPVPDWSTKQTLRALRDFRQRPPAWWPEGMLALRSHWPLRLFLAARRGRWLLKNKFKSNEPRRQSLRA